MIRGISFEIPNEYGQYLKEIFEKVPIDTYWWQVNYVDAFKITDEFNAVQLKSPHLFPDDCFLEGKKLKHIINEPEYYVIFLAMGASKNKLDDIVYMNSYNDFLESNFEILIDIYDNSYVLIYCKDDSLLKIFETNALKNNYENISFITDENDEGNFCDFKG